MQIIRASQIRKGDLIESDRFEGRVDHVLKEDNFVSVYGEDINYWEFYPNSLVIVLNR